MLKILKGHTIKPVFRKFNNELFKIQFIKKYLILGSEGLRQKNLRSFIYIK